MYIDVKKSNEIVTNSTIYNFLYNNSTWTNYIYAEELLYKLVNYSLDITINNTIGYDIFYNKLKLFKQAQKRVNEVCNNYTLNDLQMDENNTNFIGPCNPITGSINYNNDCLQYDMGCGFNCLDQVANEMNLWNQ